VDFLRISLSSIFLHFVSRILLLRPLGLNPYPSLASLRGHLKVALSPFRASAIHPRVPELQFAITDMMNLNTILYRRPIA
jgi:hypothetical protein